MAAESLAEVVQSLTLQEQDAVRQFIEYLKRRSASASLPSPFPQAADESIAELYLNTRMNFLRAMHMTRILLRGFL